MEIFYVLTKYVQSRLLQNCRMKERVKMLKSNIIIIHMLLTLFHIQVEQICSRQLWKILGKNMVYISKNELIDWGECPFQPCQSYRTHNWIDSSHLHRLTLPGYRYLITMKSLLQEEKLLIYIISNFSSMITNNVC